MTTSGGNNSPWSIFQALIKDFQGDQSAINPFQKQGQGSAGGGAVFSGAESPAPATPQASPWDQFGAPEGSSPFDILGDDPSKLDGPEVEQYNSIFSQQQDIFSKQGLPGIDLPEFSAETESLPPTGTEQPTDGAPDFSEQRESFATTGSINTQIDIDTSTFPERYAEKLPFGALKWNLDGTPNYGDGLAGWFNEWNSKIYEPKLVERNGRYIAEDPSTMDKYLRSGGYVLGSFFDAFATDPQLHFFEKAADMTTMKQLANYAQKGSIYYDRALFEEASDWAFAFIPPLYNSYEKAFKEKIRTGSYSIDQDMQNQLTAVNQIWFKRNFGTGLSDAAAYNEYLRTAMSEDSEEFHWGSEKLKTPMELAKRYENGGTNLAAQILFDPTNILDIAVSGGWKLLAKMRMLKEVPDMLKIASGAEKSVVAWRAAVKTGDEAAKATELVTLRDVIYKASVKVMGDTKISANLAQLGSSAKQTRLFKKTEHILLPLMESLKETPTLLTDALFDIAKIGSKNIDDIEFGLRELSKANPHVISLFYTENGMEVARFLNHVVEKFPVLFSQEALKMFSQGNPKKIMGHITGVIDKAVKDLYPPIMTIAENKKLIKEIIDSAKDSGKTPVIPDALKRFADIELSPAAEKVIRFHDQLQKSGFSSLARTFGAIFIMGVPGSWVRNFEQNIVHAVTDSGWGALKEIGIAAIDPDALNKLYGFQVTSVIAGTGAYGTAIGKTTNNFAGKIAKTIQGAYSWGEDTVRMGIELNETKRTLRSFLKENAAMPSFDALRAAGFDETELGSLVQRMRDNHGDVDKAVKQFLKEKGTNGVEHYRNLQVILDEKTFQVVNSRPEFAAEIESALSPENAVTMDDAIKNLQSIAKKAMDAAMGNDSVQFAGFFDEESLQHPLTQSILQNMPFEFIGKEMDLLWNKAVVRDTIIEKITRGIPMLLHENLPKTTATQFLREFFDAIGSKVLGTEGFDPSSILLQKGDRMTEVRVYQEQILTDVRKLSDILTEDGVSTVVQDAVKNLPDIAKYTEGVDISSIGNANTLKAVLWDIYYKPYLNDLYVDSTKRVIGVMVKTFNDVMTATGKDLRGFKQASKLMSEINLYGRILDAKTMEEGKLIVNSVENLIKKGNIAEALKTAAYKAGLPIVDAEGRPTISLLKTINEYIAGIADATSTVPPIKYASLQGVPFETGLKAINAWLTKNGKEALDLASFDTILKGVPHVTGRPTYAQSIQANLPGMLKTLQTVQDGVRNTWGSSKFTGAATVEQAVAISNWAFETKQRVAAARTYALAQAQRIADLSLLDYNDKQGFDYALQYFYPYQFWYSRSYKNWAARLAMNPGIANKFIDYQRWLYDYNQDQPDYLKGQIDIGSLFHMENPLYFNLMASINPLNSVTGVDYTDKKKIVGKPGTFEYAITNLIDTAGKYGPSISPLFQWSLAAYLANTGEMDAAARWAGRMFPQSAVAKAVMAKFNVNADIDPMVQIFSQGAGGDPNEINRTARAAMQLVETGQYTMNQGIEAIRNRRGPIWEQAMLLATKDRTISTIGGFLFGLGMKYQTKNDQDIARMMDESSKFWANADSYSAEEKTYFSLYMQQKYPAYDLIVIGQKRGISQMKVYGFSVLSRVPPNQLTVLANLLLPDKGNDLLEQFWNTGGNMYEINELDRDKLMTAFIELGQLLDMPTGANQKEWADVNILYQRAGDAVVDKFGPDINYYTFMYYDLMKEDNRDADAFAEQYPFVLDAIDYKNSIILQNPLLAKYYASYSKAQTWYDNRWGDIVREKINKDYFMIAHERDMFNDPEMKKEYEKSVGWETMNKKYNAMQAEWNKQVKFKQLDLDKYLMLQDLGYNITKSPPEDLSVGQNAVLEMLDTKDIAVDRLQNLDWKKVMDTGHVLPQFEAEFYKWSNNPAYVLSGPANGQINALMALMNDLDPETGYTRDDMIYMIRNYYTK